MTRVNINYLGNKDILSYMTFETIPYQLTLIRSMLKYCLKREYKENTDDIVNMEWYTQEIEGEVKKYWRLNYQVRQHQYRRTRHNYGFGDMIELQKTGEISLFSKTWEKIEKLSKLYQFAERVSQGIMEKDEKKRKEYLFRFNAWERDILQEKLYQWVYEEKIQLSNKEKWYELIDKIYEDDIKKQRNAEEFAKLFKSSEEINKLFEE